MISGLLALRRHLLLLSLILVGSLFALEGSGLTLIVPVAPNDSIVTGLVLEYAILITLNFRAEKVSTGIGQTFGKEDYERLDPSIRQGVKAQFRKLQEKPELGRPCGHKMGYDLTCYRSLHFYGNRYRIVYEYEIVREEKVRIWGIGKRERGKVYRMVHERVGQSGKGL